MRMILCSPSEAGWTQKPRFRARACRALLVCTAALYALPASAQDYTLNANSLNAISSSTLTLNGSALQLNNTAVAIDSSTLTLDGAALDRALELPRLQPGVAIAPLPTPGPATGGGAVPGGGQLSAREVGIGRLVAPGAEDSGVLVGRLGTLPVADSANLTIDFTGDGLINFEIDPGLVAGPGETAAGPLAGRVVAVGAGTADRVLDDVINIADLTPATTFEVTEGTVVLGGARTPDLTAGVAIRPQPRNPNSDPTTNPDGTPEHDPDWDSGGDDEPGSELDPCRAGMFPCFSIVRPVPPTPASGSGPSTDDLLDVSIFLPLRQSEPEGDQFSNYGNEEIW